MNVVIAPKRHRITVDEFHRMGEAGIFSEDERVELVEGEIIDMAPIGTRHAETVRRLIQVISSQLPSIALLDVQNPIYLDENNLPQPDLTLLKNQSYIDTHPSSRDVLLLIEVADTSLDYDRNVKIPLYARHKIPEVWLVNLEDRVVEVYRDAAHQEYASVQTYRKEKIIQAEVIAGIKLNPVKLFT